MKKQSARLCAFMMVLVVAQPSSSSAAEVIATIDAPTTFTHTNLCTPQETSCEKYVVAQHQRCLYLLQPAQAQTAQGGRFGFVITITSAMRGKPFTLTPVPANSADFDVTFYESLGTCNDDPGPDTDFAGQDGRHAHFGTGVERGTVPRAFEDDEDETAGARYAIVTVFGAAQAKFTFTA